jgi:predicted glycoside hydrolase/deacetylase ChbG (UPF0249 family)
MGFRLLTILTFASIFLLTACEQKKQTSEKVPANWAERLGYPAGKKVIMLHADDAGMCEEANIATMQYFEKGHIQSASAMPPCPKFDEFMEWAKENPQYDIGLHLTFTSEFERYRWSTVLPVEEVPSLNDEDGKIWLEIRDVLANATPEDVAKEIRGQIDKSIQLGFRPTHIDTHEGTLYASLEYAKAFLQAAMDYNIPANVPDLSDPEILAYWREKGKGTIFTDEFVEFMNSYTLPKLDYIFAVEPADSYENKIENFKKLIGSLKPGLTEILSFHPAIESEQLKVITNAWKQRVWEAKMFADPEIIEFLESEDVIFTNWKEIMRRFEMSKSSI